MEEPDACYALGSCSDAERSVFFYDASKRIDRDRGGGFTGGFEGVESGWWGDVETVDGFTEDWGEEDGVGVVALRDVDLGERVAGDGNDRTRKAVDRVAAANLGWEDGRVRGQMNAVGLGFNGCAEA